MLKRLIATICATLLNYTNKKEKGRGFRRKKWEVGEDDDNSSSAFVFVDEDNGYVKTIAIIFL